jgi:prepilin-type N-terminal cleavage/methylation domain-containing protein
MTPSTRHPSSRRRPGLTLIELLAVLVVLVAVAGIVVVSFPSMLTRANVSSCMANVSETARAIMFFETEHGSYPDGYDSLTDGTNLHPDLLNKGPTPGTFNGMTALPLTAAQVAALDEAGVRTVHIHAAAGSPAPYHLTFNPYANPNANSGTPITAGMNLGFLTPAAAQSVGLPMVVTGTDESHAYVLLGLGKRCTLFGRTVMEPPVHFADKTEESPNLGYGRYAAVFSVGTATNPLSKAKFVRVLTFHPEGPVGSTEHVEEFWNIQGNSK